MPGYTRRVGRLSGTVSALLIALLAAGSAVASVCEASCSEPHGSTVSASAHSAIHEGTAAAHHPAPSGNDAAGMHEHHRAKASPTAVPANSTEVKGPAGRDCCGMFTPPRPSARAVRADANLLPTSAAAGLADVVSFELLQRQPVGPTHGPPGSSSPLRSPLVLRI